MLKTFLVFSLFLCPSPPFFFQIILHVNIFKSTKIFSIILYSVSHYYLHTEPNNCSQGRWVFCSCWNWVDWPSPLKPLPRFLLLSHPGYSCPLSPTEYSEGESLFYIVSPRDVVVAKERDQDDHIDWLLEKKKYEVAWFYFFESISISVT